jgi:type IV pilus assembly protein PilY1
VNIDSSGSSRYPALSAANNVPDLSGWTTTVNNFEKNASTTYVDGQGTNRTTGNPNGSNNSMPIDYMIGAAYWAHTHDIRGTGWTGEGGATGKQRPGLRVKSYSFDVNEFSQQSVDSTRRNANELFMVSKYGGFQADPANQGKNPYNTWGNPFKKEDGTNDNSVWRDPTRLGPDGVAGNIGEASTYYLQSNARGVLSAFDEIFGNAAAEAKSIAGAAVQSRNVTNAGNAIYQAGFDSGDWSGDLTSIPVTANGSGTATTIGVGTTATWSASDRLGALTTRATDRNIVVGKPGATANPAAIPFLWANVSGTTLETDLNKLTPVAASDGLAQDRLNWLRGSKAKEANPFRARGDKYLGDIVNSSVAYSGAPGLPSPQLSSANYVGFYNDNKTRTAAVFVGANDGMLHGFNAANGNELFAYIPSWMGPKLAALTEPTYLVNHQAYVDGSPTVAEAQVGSAGTKDDWKTVLVSGTGAGGQGVFALDVTDPTAFSASKVMWEFTHTDDVDLGNVIGRPQILRMRTNASGAATYKWFAVVPSGVNNYGTAVGGQYSDGNPTLFFLALDKTVGAAWTLGTNYYKVKLPFDSTLATTKPTGLVNFSIVRNGVSGDITQMYMGDLHGKIWKLNFSGVAIADWNINKLTAFDKDPDAANVTPFPLYIAKDASSNIQPITMAPTIAIGPTQNSYYVLFGTGKYLEAADKTTTTVQSVYALYDNGTNNADSSPIASAASIISGRGRLRAGTLDTSLRTVTVSDFKWGRAGSDADLTQRSGWYFDFATTGERQISNFEIIGTKVVFASLYPGSSGGALSCTASGGGGNLYTVDILSGNGAYRVSDVGILGAVIPFELPQATQVSERDSAGRRKKTIKTASVTQGALGAGTPSYQLTDIDAGRLSWRLINNYQELKKATTP